MALSGILVGAADVRPKWLEVGASMIAIDTLVHNFLHRTGILRRLEAAHPYGPGCYRPGGGAEIIRLVAQRIDAWRFNRAFPQVFPRFVQLAIWRYCSQQGLDICNGNRLDDRHRWPKPALSAVPALRPNSPEITTQSSMTRLLLIMPFA